MSAVKTLLVACLLSLVLVSPVQADDHLSQSCDPESIPYFYGFSVGPDYIYRQTQEHQTNPSRFMTLPRGSLNVVQFDIWEELALYRVDSKLVPIESLVRGDLYAFTEFTLRWMGMFWRHQQIPAGTPEGVIGGQPMTLEGRLGGWHVWDLQIGVENPDEDYEPFCNFKFFVYFYDVDSAE